MLAAPLLCAALLLLFAHAAGAQGARPPATSTMNSPATSPALVRRTTRREVRRIDYGGGLTLYGAPVGSITVEAWSRKEIEIVAETELRADTEEELDRLAAVNTFVLENTGLRVRVNTVGTHDRKHVKRAGGKNFPKKLFNAAWRIDYTVRVPLYTDLEIYAGRGTVSVGGVEGAMRLNVADGDMTLSPAGGDCAAIVARGRIVFRPASRSWRGRGVDLRVDAGEIVAELTAGFNADLDARVLRSGAIENTFGELTPLDLSDAPTSPAAAARNSRGRFGAGGAAFSLTVGTGDIRVRQIKAAGN